VTITCSLVLISWVLFRSDSLHDALTYLGAMIGKGGSGPGRLFLPALLYTKKTLLAMTIGTAVLAWPTQAHDWSRDVLWSKSLLVQPLFAASLVAMFAQSFNPFLYFQF
jgi:alginate O-acetyltransferase complex protein AlgI